MNACPAGVAIPGFPRYTVTPDGALWSSYGGGYRMRGRGPMRRVSLKADGVERQASIRELVCEAYHGPRPRPDLRAMALNGDIDDTRPENLAWRHRGKLTAADRQSIRDAATRGVRQADIAAVFGVTQSLVAKVLAGLVGKWDRALPVKRPKAPPRPARRRIRRTSPEDRRRMVDLRAAGQSKRSIARETGFTYNTVQKALTGPVGSQQLRISPAPAGGQRRLQSAN